MKAQTRERILSKNIEEEMRESFLDYSMSVIVQRALPDVRDGLKPVHRRILFAMHEAGLRPDKAYKKCATVVGDVLGKYHPHGDSAVYDALVRMVQEFSLRYPLIDGQGNFGSIDGDSAAAYRYTEARLSAISEQILADIGKETVNVAENFDGQRQEPVVLPSRVPNLLINGSSGIAVGLSTNVPPHNLGEVASALKALIEEPEPSLDLIMSYLPGPDFPTGGQIVGTTGIRDMYETGKGRIVMRAKIIKETARGGKELLVVTELPYAVTKTRIIQQIATLSRKGGVASVSDIRDESDRDGIRLVLEMKKGAISSETIQELYKRTSLQSTFGAILIALDAGQPKQFNLIELLERFKDHRIDVIQRRSLYDLERAEAEKHVIEGLMAALNVIEEVISIIRESADRRGAFNGLQDLLGLSEIQADAILNMRLAKLTALEQKGLNERLAELEVAIRELRGIVRSEARKLEIIHEEMDAIVEQFGDERRTLIIEGGDSEPYLIEEKIADEEIVVTHTHYGFVKRIPMRLYKRRIASGRPLTNMDDFEGDYIENVIFTKTQDYLLAFTEKGRVHFLLASEITEGKINSRGKSVYALTGSDREDAIVRLIPTGSLATNAFIVSVTKKGMVKRTAISEYSHPRNGGIIAGKVKSGDHILDVSITDGDCDLLILTRDGRSILFSESEIPIVGRPALGVKGVGLQQGDSVVSMLTIRRDGLVLCVAQNGSGKKIETKDFPIRKRGGLGTSLMSTEEGDFLVSALEVVDGDQLTIITELGDAHPIRIDDIPLQKLRKKLRPLVGLQKNDVVIEVASEHASKEIVEEETTASEHASKEIVEEETTASEQMSLLD
ncbi:MAG: DNA gyrase subunit A [Longimicrobiales bacterium]|mgnify:CR=1 FL=1|nr:DNA gyrase subunit A [Longimicrobiales bacterium]